VAFPLAAVLLALLPFVLLEATLALLGVGSANGPTAGFSQSERLFELDEDEQVYSTARRRRMFFGPAEFTREKPKETFRIFGLGGSTVHGRPYENETSFLEWLELELAGRDSSRDFETINCGGLSYASYRLTYLLDEVLQYEPDLIIIATGHNEFLEDRTYGAEKHRSPVLRWTLSTCGRLRTVTAARQLLFDESETATDFESSALESEVEARLDRESGYASYHRDDAWRESVVEQYAQSLRRLVSACDEAGVPLILINLGENLRDCPPFKSEHKPGLSAELQQSWQLAFDKATKLDDTDPEQALAAYAEAESIDDEYALLAFRMARCLDRLGRVDEAQRYYDRARDLDICPLRMVTELHEQLRQVAAETDTPLVDAEALAVALSPDGIPGNNCYMDHVHPNIGSHQQIGCLLADEVEAMGLAGDGRSWNAARRRQIYRRHFRSLGPAYLANGRRRVGWLENWARRERLDAEATPRDPRGHLHLGQKRLDYGEVHAAWEQFLLAMTLDRSLADDVLAHAFDLFKQGRNDLAGELLVLLHREPLAAELQPAVQLAYLITAVDAGKLAEAEAVYAAYRPALEAAASDPTAQQWLAAMPDVLERMVAHRATSPGPTVDDPFLPPTATGEGNATPAPAADASKRPQVAQLLDKAIEANPKSAPLHLSRARMRFANQEYDAALVDVSRALELSPDHVEAYKFRAILQMIRSEPQAAVDDLTAALAVESGDADALRMRAAAHRRLGNDSEADADLEEAERLAPEG